MKKGIFSGIIILLMIFLVAATTIYSRLPIQEIKTTAELGGIKNFNFSVQIARDIADTALTEALSDEIYMRTNLCAVNLGTGDSIKGRFIDYIDFDDGSGPQNVDFGACKIIPPASINFTETVPGQEGNVVLDIEVLCELPQDGPTKIIYRRKFTLKKEYLLVDPGTGCESQITDTDSGLLVFTQSIS